MKYEPSEAANDLLEFASRQRFRTILADPPWQFTNRTGKVAPSIAGCHATAHYRWRTSSRCRSTGSRPKRRTSIFEYRTRSCQKG